MNNSIRKKLEKIVNDYFDKNKINNKTKEKLLEISTAWNKEIVVEELITRMEQFKTMYENETHFPYEIYIDKLTENTIDKN